MAVWLRHMTRTLRWHRMFHERITPEEWHAKMERAAHGKCPAVAPLVRELIRLGGPMTPKDAADAVAEDVGAPLDDVRVNLVLAVELKTLTVADGVLI